MLPSCGYFRDIPCPYLKSGLCQRAQCHYKHDNVGPTRMRHDGKHQYVTKALSTQTASSSSGRIKSCHSADTPMPDYVPTPLAKLKAIIGRKEKDDVSVSYVPEYKPTPISELKKRQDIRDNQDNQDSQDSHHHQAHLKHNLKEVKPKANQSKDTSICKVVKVEKSDTQSLEHKVKQEDYDKIREFKVEDESQDDDQDEVQLISDLVRKRKSSDIQSNDIIDSDSNSKKKRLAHQPVIPSLQVVNKLRPSPAQVMHQRFIEAQNKKDTSSPQQVQTTPLTLSSTRVAHKPKIKVENDSSSIKVKERVAHVPNPKALKRPIIPAQFGNKIPLKSRQQYLNKFIDELLKFTDEQEAFKRGLEIEKSAYDRCTTKSIYISLSANSVKKIREEAEERKNLKADSLSPTKKQPIQTGNKTISHDKMLNGKINGTFSIGKKTKALTEKDLTEIELYKMLTKYIMSESSLREYGMPRADPYKKGNAILPILQSRAQKNDYESQIRTCSRCQKTYTVDERGMPAKFEACIFHQGRLWNERFNKTVDKKYSCCKNPAGSIGCDSSKYHVIDGYDNPDYCKNYVKTIAKKAPSDGFYGIYALDCEMCYTTVGLELIKVTVIDTQERVVFESLVKPSNPILDYNSRFSGIRKGDLDKVTTTLKQIHQELLTLFNDKTILIGHSLDSDLRALKMIHDTICDTTMIFPHKRGLPFRRALRNLTAEYLKEIIQDNAEGHDSKEDAIAAMKLVMWRIREDLKKFKR